MAYWLGSIRIFILLFVAVVCPFSSFCAQAEEPGRVYTIRFAVIEPPVVAQKDITVKAPMSNQQTEPKALECSGLAWLDGILIIVSDRHEHLLFTCPIDLNKMEIGTPDHQVMIRNEQFLLDDAESLALVKKDGDASLYVMCSLSNAPNAQPLPQRRHLFYGKIRSLQPLTLDRSKVISAGTLRQQLESRFETIGFLPYYTFNADPGENKNTYRWANAEGITFTPDGRMLLCGMRNPLFDNTAMLFAVSGMPEMGRPVQPDSLKVIDLFLLDLDGRGISDLCWDPITRGYLITAAKSNGPRLNPNSPYPPNTLDSALFWWSGNKKDSPILVARIPDMSIEAVCRLGDSRYIALGSDEGDISEGRGARQSILTIMEFTGIPR
ncbi:MAG: hypothetical protein JXB18_09350 [Sedimentisphaerales bacterium]|nr:hypothetical protein [Sedimentisphaerales bacterium]